MNSQQNEALKRLAELRSKREELAGRIAKEQAAQSTLAETLQAAKTAMVETAADGNDTTKSRKTLMDAATALDESFDVATVLSSRLREITREIETLRADVLAAEREDLTNEWFLLAESWNKKGREVAAIFDKMNQILMEISRTNGYKFEAGPNCPAGFRTALLPKIFTPGEPLPSGQPYASGNFWLLNPVYAEKS